jgi:NAD(P)H-dependent flavin oxidoreductase YrpB (nitropropane dioxygenase family)
MFMKTALCHTLGIEHPIIAAPMGPDLSGPELVAAVSNAGGLGIVQAQLHPPPRFREGIRRVRALIARPFGVNLLLHFPADRRWCWSLGSWTRWPRGPWLPRVASRTPGAWWRFWRWGAQAAVLGTRFLASAESRAHPHYKQRVLVADDGDTVRTILFGHVWPNAPHRTLRTAFVQHWLGQEGRG